MKLPFTFEKKQDSSQFNGDLDEGQDRATMDRQAGSEYRAIEGLSDLYFPEESGESHVPDVADVLLETGKITPEVHAGLRREQSSGIGCDVGTMLLEAGQVTPDDLFMAKAQLHGLDFRRIEPQSVRKEAFEKLDVDFMKSNGVIPFAIEQDTLLVATSEPENMFVIEEVKRQTEMSLQVVVCSPQDIETACDACKAERAEYSLDDIISDMEEVEVVQDQNSEIVEDLEKMAGQSPVIRFVNYLISNAVHEGASDIHIEPKDKTAKVRYRIDGVLFDTMQPPLKMHAAIVSRIKIMANLDISERRLPQDGKISAIVGGRAIDLRISTLPTSHGEKVVIRILDSRSIMRGLEQLGMEAEVMRAFGEQISLPHGILLVTGPTGSGKSTTLYSALSQMDGHKLNISTVEDPVEYELDFCNQVQVNEKIGLTFASALRSLLRQDPDVMMIGEIRDNETARIAVQAALTGHLVLSTLHTNDAASSVTRLVNIGIDDYLIAASLNAVLAQRLVRKICPKCKRRHRLSKSMRKHIESLGLKPQELLMGRGCEHCRGSGYMDRMGIYELLVIDERFREMITKDSSAANMRRAFYENQGVSLFEDGLTKVKHGLTTIEEVLRVTEVCGQGEEQVFPEHVTQSGANKAAVEKTRTSKKYGGQEQVQEPVPVEKLGYNVK